MAFFVWSSWVYDIVSVAIAPLSIGSKYPSGMLSILSENVLF